MNESLQLFFLLIILLSMGLWPLLPRRTSPRWRFEFFSIDFAVGVAVTGLVLALALGNSGLLSGQSDLSLGDRLLLASKTAQALTLFAGVTLGLGFLALFGAARLLGMGLSLVLSLGGAGLVDAALPLSRSFKPELAAGLVLLAAGLVLGYRAARRQDPKVAAKPVRPGMPVRRLVRQSTKGIALAGFAAILFGLGIPLAVSGISGDLGAGPFAGILLLTPGTLPAVVTFALILLNIQIELPATNFGGYFGGKGREHFLGWSCGGTWCLGVFLVMVLATRTVNAEGGFSWPAMALGAGLAVGTLLAFSGERKLTKRSGAGWLAVICFSLGVMLVGLGMFR